MEATRNLKGILNDVYEIATKKGYKVFTFESKNPQNRRSEIEQIFITDGERIGTCSIKYWAADFGTVHKPHRKIGTGFGDVESKTLEEGIENCMAFCPNWVSSNDRKYIEKYKSAEDYFNKETILNYYYL